MDGEVQIRQAQSFASRLCLSPSLNEVLWISAISAQGDAAHSLEWEIKSAQRPFANISERFCGGISGGFWQRRFKIELVY